MESVDKTTEEGKMQGVGCGGGLGASAPTVPDNAAIERQMHYLCETNARMSELKIRTKNAKHWIGRRLPAYADDELMHLAYEAEKLRLHLRAWNDYVISSPNEKLTDHHPE